MSGIDTKPSTGLPGLDCLLNGLMPGDNIVWQVDGIDDYLPFAGPYIRHALASGKRFIYFRFAGHRSLADQGDGVEVVRLDPEAGFEQFVTEIHKTIKSVGAGGYYLFDCLSALATDWYSDQMLGNFFMLTCPYLYQVKAIACFPLLRNYHSFYATSPIAETTQVLLDVLHRKGIYYVHPIKVEDRYSPTMHMLHAWRDDEFSPVTQSATVSEILRSVPWQGLESPSYRQDVWNRTFLQAEETLAAIRRGETPPEKIDEYFDRLLRMAISRHKRMGDLAGKYLTLSDILEIGRRIIGTGLIGGKSVGMLLSRAILEQSDRRWAEILEPHDSFYVGSDVFYTFLVRNDVWWVRQKQRDPDAFLEGAEEARERIMSGDFPEYIKGQFADMLDYFGQSPIIARSSSLLEDNFGNAFAGKYESIFCVNQGPKQKRLSELLSAVREIYASTMSEAALTYRSQRGLLAQDEQMAILVQRVSGAIGGDMFYPHFAGVGLSYNPYVWSKDIDPSAGVVRLVFGLGTRAVEHHDDDYTRVVALNAPARRPQSSADDARQYSQKSVDVLDLQANRFVSRKFSEVARTSASVPLEMFASYDQDLAARAQELALPDVFPYVLTFGKLLKDTLIVSDMRGMLDALQAAYKYPVDIEFTGNFVNEHQYRLNLVQCRPFQCKGGAPDVEVPGDVDPHDLVLNVTGPVIGRSRQETIGRIIYVVPSAYSELPVSERYGVARLIGEIIHSQNSADRQIMLLGPGRWGTSSPQLGVPIRFSEIDRISTLCEIVVMREGLVPDVSLGTHLFSEMVEMDILYLAVFPDRKGNFVNAELLESAPSKLTELVCGSEKWQRTVRVIDSADLDGASSIEMVADMFAQKAVCHIQRAGG